MQEKISGVYKIENTLTGDFYIGSSIDVKRRWRYHKCPSTWNRHSKYPLYLDMQKYGVGKFIFEILAEVEIKHLKEKEQQFIEMLNPTYNNYNANGRNVDRRKEYNKEYQKSDKRKEYNKEYQKSDKYKEYKKEYNNQLCSYNGETITLCALSKRFQKAGVEHPTLESKKYLIKN